jgi:hypothetical protein
VYAHLAHGKMNDLLFIHINAKRGKFPWRINATAQGFGAGAYHLIA